MKNSIQLNIVFLLLAKKIVTASEIAEKYNISRRTVYRYINEISDVIPIYTVHGSKGGYSVVDSFRLPSSFLTEGEYKAAIEALEAFAKELPGAEISSVIDKLKSSAKSCKGFSLSSSTLMIDSGPWGVTANYKNKVNVLEESVANGKVVFITYRDSEGARTERYIEPHTLVLKQGIWYVYAFCRQRCDFRLFKIGRIESIIITEETFERKNTDGLEKVFDYRSGLDGEEVVLNVESSVISEIEEWLGVEYVSKRGEEYIASALLPINSGLVSKIIGFGGKVKVVSPQSLKDRVRKTAKEILAKY